MVLHQTPDWSALHTVEEMQRLSNLGHRIEGVLLATVALIALGEAIGLIRKKFLWPIIITVAGVFLVVYLLFHHSLEKFELVWKLIMADSQQRQHLIMAGLLTIAGIGEIIYRKKNLKLFAFIWPIVMCVIGIMFLTHEQHGSSQAVEWAQTIHRYLGILLILVSAGILLAITFGLKYKWTRFVWPILLLLASIFLFIYKEPKGAYEQRQDVDHDARH
jgi:hypothetical protein